MNNKNESRSLPLFGIPRLFPFLKKYRAKIAFMILLGFLSSLIDTIYPLFNRYAIDHFVAEKTLDGMYVKFVPSNVREFIDMKADSIKPRTSADRKKKNEVTDEEE